MSGRAATRGELLPDPAHDPVELVAFVVRDDARRAMDMRDYVVRTALRCTALDKNGWCRTALPVFLIVWGL
jgi:hypothetical protein